MSAPELRPSARVGRPAPFALTAAYFAAALGCWLAAVVTLAVAATDLANAGLAAPDVLLAVHLVALGFLPFAVAGAVFHVLPTLLRNDASRAGPWLALPLLLAGPALAVGIAHDLDDVVGPAAAVESAGFLVVACELVRFVAQAPRGRMLLASRAGVLLSTLNAAAALAFGAALASRESRPLWGIPHERAIAIHLHLAVLGWLTLLILTVGRTLAPMLALAPAAPVRTFPLGEIVLAAGVWLLAAGLAVGQRPLEAAGGLLAIAAVASFALLTARTARGHRLHGLEGPIVHLATGLFFLGQAAILGLSMVFGAGTGARRLVAYVVALLVGWAGGVTLGHLGKLLSLSAWASWPPGPRPRQLQLYPRRVWLLEAVAFAVGVEIVVDGALAGSPTTVRAGAVALVGCAVAACAGAAATLRRSGPALS